jgi:hypothetical protein
VYIIKERLIKYIRSIERFFIKDTLCSEVKSYLNPLYKLISNTLKSIVNLRGEHVHKKRFSDYHLSRLSSMELLMKSQDKIFRNQIEILLNSSYKEISKLWKKNIADNNKIISALLSDIGKVLNKVLFNENGSNLVLVVPKNYGG